MANLIEFISKNAGMISAILFLVLSELMDWMPKLKASSITKFIYQFLKGETQKAHPEIDKLINEEKK